MKYDVCVIGGGPAGMMAAGQLAEQGQRVVLLEKNQELGIKLLMTGKARCNITNAEEDLKKIIKVYGKNGKFLYSALNNFSNKDIVEFFENRGLKTKVERGNRIFTSSDKSQDVLDCLKKYLSDNNVDIKYNTPVKKLTVEGDKIIRADGIVADNFVIATGGKSYPASGSTGDAYAWLEELGHTIIEPRPALTPIIVKEKIVKELEGLSLKNVEISLWDSKKISSYFGEAVFTAQGLSGPTILNLSKQAKEGLKLKIDFKPALDFPALDKRIQKDFTEFNNKQFKNSLNQLMPAKLIPVMIRLSGINPNKKVNEVTKEERKKLVKLLKEFELTIKGVVGFSKAIVTSGGVSLKEVDPKTMKSKIIDNLYFAGEVLDIDGPTGGYNLQVCWSTGYAIDLSK